MDTFESKKNTPKFKFWTLLGVKNLPKLKFWTFKCYLKDQNHKLSNAKWYQN